MRTEVAARREGASLVQPAVLTEIDTGNRASAAVAERLGMAPFAAVDGLLGPMTRYRKTR